MNPPTSDSPTFEQALAELEKTVRGLEEGNAGLEESLAQYEQGIGLLKRCFEKLRQAEQRIQKLVGLDPEGKPITQPFNHSATTEGDRTPNGKNKRSE